MLAGELVDVGEETETHGVMADGDVGLGGFAGRLRLARAWCVEIFGMADRSRRYAFVGGVYVKVSLYLVCGPAV